MRKKTEKPYQKVLPVQASNLFQASTQTKIIWLRAWWWLLLTLFSKAISVNPITRYVVITLSHNALYPLPLPPLNFIASLYCKHIIRTLLAISCHHFKNGKGLGPVHRSIEPVEMLPRIQFYTIFVHVAASQRIQYSYTLDPSRSFKK